MPERPAPQHPLTDLLKPDEVAGIVGGLSGAAYRWTPHDDVIVWSEAVAAVLGPERLPHAGSGQAYQALIAAGSGLSRAEAVVTAQTPGGLAGLKLFETSYCLAAPPEARPARLWVEDRGVCHLGEDGRIIAVEGVVRRLSIGRPARPAGSLGGIEPQSERQRLSQMVDDRLSQAYRDGSEFGFLLIGIDHLGRLNDLYGFHIGDELVDIVWMRLRAQLAEGQEIARFSGAKFGIVLPRLGPEGLGATQRLLAGVNATPPRTSAGGVAITVSAGGLVAPRHGRSVAEVFSHAQDMLAAARASGSGGLAIYSPGNDRAAERRANLRFADDIISALSENRVTLAFQPIARADSREIALHEALVRIQGRTGRVYDGSSIIPIADRFGLTRLLDRRSLALALAALRADPGLCLSVNVAPGSVHDDVWQRQLEAASAEGLCERLIVELTESASISDLDAMRGRVAWLHGLGCRVAMDDFGVGYTSFRSLRRLGIDVLKIDGSFICAMAQSEDDRHFVRTIVELASKLGIETVAEWVLDEEAARDLAAWGCTYLQGELTGLAAERPLSGRVPEGA
ncbi:GGDEF and EAL domain-containing protein [Ancylobacter sp. SL191]|uniref:GGDEF and EAL domain-containing protein n=1 Tax=Ancylobacter sp. SL191 TaxID=2995166 RepID=UPI00226E6ED4|nr:GGDEF and EAL domain-containing protein [Ancylobacter sp. SL191]WAC29162.1 GGDEF and EAL domain-containing protein [Ancylobacter sp. SL191]